MFSKIIHYFKDLTREKKLNRPWDYGFRDGVNGVTIKSFEPVYLCGWSYGKIVAKQKEKE